MTKMTHVLMMTLPTLLTLIMTSTSAIDPDAQANSQSGQGIHHQIQYPPVSVKTQHSLAQTYPICRNVEERCRFTNECQVGFQCSPPRPQKCRMPSGPAKRCRPNGRYCLTSSECCACLSCRRSHESKPEEDLGTNIEKRLLYVSPRCYPIDKIEHMPL